MEENAWFSFWITLWRPPTDPDFGSPGAVCPAGKPCGAIWSNNWLKRALQQTGHATDHSPSAGAFSL